MLSFKYLEMPFTVQDFQDLLALLDSRPDWRDELLWRLLSERFQRLPDEVDQLKVAIAKLAYRRSAALSSIRRDLHCCKKPSPWLGMVSWMSCSRPVHLKAKRCGC